MTKQTRKQLFWAGKWVGQFGVVIYSVFLEPMPVAAQLAVWPRMMIAIGLILALPLRTQFLKGRRVGMTIFAVLLIAVGIGSGFSYWLQLPPRSIAVRGDIYVTGAPTAESLEELRRLDLPEDVAGLRRLIEGQPHKDVESFYMSEVLVENKRLLGALYILFVAPTAIGFVGQ